jgi:hypothetical protein
VTVNTSFYVQPRLRMSGVLSLFPLHAFMVKRTVYFTCLYRVNRKAKSVFLIEQVPTKLQIRDVNGY